LKSLVGRKNWYWCSKCRGWTVTVDLEGGVTPFMINCRAREDCTNMTTSMLYPEIPPPGAPTEPSWEWYRPTRAQLMSLPFELQEHVKQGGLLVRKIGAELSDLTAN
jgi:hypothetical protein